MNGGASFIRNYLIIELDVKNAFLQSYLQRLDEDTFKSQLLDQKADQKTLKLLLQTQVIASSMVEPILLCLLYSCDKN